MPTTRTVHVEVTQELIKEHITEVTDCEDCPGWWAINAAGAEVGTVGIHWAHLDDGTTLDLPPEFGNWQRDAILAYNRLQMERPTAGLSELRLALAAEVKPIAFDLEVPEA